MHRLNRRAVLTALGGTAMAWPLGAKAQQKRLPVVGYLGFTSTNQENLVAFRQGLAERGYTDGKTVALEVRWAEGNYDRLPGLVADLVARKIDVFGVGAGPVCLRAARQATTTLPLVAYDFETDPVAEGYVQSIARVGGNVTGIFLDQPDFAGKWFELLRECIPRLASVAMLLDPGSGRAQVASMSKVAAGLGINVTMLEVKTRADYASVFAAAQNLGVGAVLMPSSPLVLNNSEELAELARRYRLPGITLFSRFARGGGFMSYGPSIGVAAKQAGVIVGKILAGAAPAALPVERPSTFELIVNQRTASTLGLTIPALIAARADEVIE